MKKAKTPNLTPQKLWRYTDPDTSMFLKASSLSVLLNKIYKHRVACGFEMSGGWKEWAEDIICNCSPEAPCLDSEKPERYYGADDVRRFLATMQEFIAAGTQIVPVAEQERRAAICMACPAKGQINCKWCGWVGATVNGIIAHRSFEGKLELHKQSCMKCGCNLPAKTAMPLDVLHEADKKLEPITGKVEYEPGCWMLE